MAFTPAIIQYLDIKKEHADCILFFRMGDFYETFFEDAKLCSKVLDIVLTSKNKNSENSVPMAGIPYHSVEKYITKLIAHGYKIAIAEQTTTPVPGKIVEREVVSIITPGTYIQETQKEFTYTMAINFLPYISGESYHIAWGDFSIGEYWTKSFADVVEMQKFILSIKPVELIFESHFPEKESVSSSIKQYLNCLISLRDVPPDPEKFLAASTQVQQSASYGKAVEGGRLEVMTLLLYYLTHTQTYALTNITRISFHSQDIYLILDEVTIKNLELLSSTYEGSEKYSLLNVLDTTQTAGGARLLRTIITNPIKDLTQLQRRLQSIKHYLNDEVIERVKEGTIYREERSKHMHQLLSHVRDIPKLVSIILYKKLLPNTFIKLRSTLRIFFENKFLLDELSYLGLSKDTESLLQHLYNYLEQILKNDDEYSDDIDFIRDGYHDKIDELRKIAYHSDELLLQYQQELAQIASIPNVKVKFVLNQGYFLEVTNKDITIFEEKLSKINGALRVESGEGNGAGNEKYTIVRRNTLKGGQRYSSPYLENLQVNILKAKDDLRRLEYEFLQQAQQKILGGTSQLNEFSQYIAWFDLFVSQALLAKEKKFVQPDFIPGESLAIIGGRHPVIEKYLPLDQQFIPNDLQLNGELNIESGELSVESGEGKHIETNENSGFLHIITGPNMGGKSTYLRQNALIVLMAHCGLFVPAQSCTLGVVDAIFARIGSGDIIAKNQSTFMTEMIEVANILNNASKKSFIIFDELGRGTATYDGLALTKAILEYLVTNIGAKTLIATHYHELIQLEEHLVGVRNYSVRVYETEKEVIFMKKIVRGGASKSYGLDVAKLAGIPATIVQRAKGHLDTLEQEKKGGTRNEGTENKDEGLLSPSIDVGLNAQNSLAYEKMKSLLESYDLNAITPLQALQLLNKIKDDLH